VHLGEPLSDLFGDDEESDRCQCPWLMHPQRHDQRPPLHRALSDHGNQRFHWRSSRQRLTLVTNPTPGQLYTYSQSGYFIYNDVLYAGQSQFVDLYGPLFTLSNGIEVNLYNNGSSSNPQYLYYDSTGFNVPIQFAITPIPEPGSLTLLSIGFLGLCGYTFRRAKNRCR
jgi:hypothetical protein